MEANLSVGVVPCTTDTEPAYLTDGTTFRSRALFFSYFFGAPRVPGRTHAYGRPGWADFVNELERGAQAVVVHTHSNGVDARIGDAVLCARLMAESIATERCLPCQSGGPCIRETIPTLQRFLTPSFLQCRALVLLGCTGFPPADSLLDYRASLVHAALHQGAVTSVVTSIRLSTASLSLALAAKKFLEAGGSMGELALQINRQEPGRLPHFICLGDPHYRPFARVSDDEPVHVAPPLVRDEHRGPHVIELLAEAELLAAVKHSDWPSIHARIDRVSVVARTPAYLPIESRSTSLSGVRLGRPIPGAERAAAGPPCPECGAPQSRYRWQARASVGALCVDHCPSHGVTACESTEAGVNASGSARAARLMFTALSLRCLAAQGFVSPNRFVELAVTLERSALSNPSAVPVTPRDVDLHIARLVADHVRAGGEAFMNRQLRYVSPREEVDTGTYTRAERRWWGPTMLLCRCACGGACGCARCAASRANHRGSIACPSST